MHLNRPSAVFHSVAVSLALFTLAARAEHPTREAIVAYAAQCKQTKQTMDLVARFGTDFSGLDLQGVDFRGAHQMGLETNLRGANLSHANLRDAQFGGAILDAADLTGANLDGASFVTALLQHVIIQDTSLKGTNFYQCNLSHAKLVRADLSQAKITGAHFAGADLSGAGLSGAVNDHWWLDFHGANLTGADLGGMRLNGANFRSATLHSATLSECELEQADFSDADLTNAAFDQAHVKAAIFRGARGLKDDDRRWLMAEAGRWQFELKTGITSFLDSALFPICLLLVVPAVALTAGRFSRRLRQLREKPLGSSRFQFTVSGLLWVALVLCLFLGIARWSESGAFSFAMVMPDT